MAPPSLLCLHIYFSLLIDKDLCDSRTGSIKFPCTLTVYSCLSSGDFLVFRYFHVILLNYYSQAPGSYPLPASSRQLLKCIYLCTEARCVHIFLCLKFYFIFLLSSLLQLLHPQISKSWFSYFSRWTSIQIFFEAAFLDAFFTRGHTS